MLAINQKRKCFNLDTNRWEECKKPVTSKGYSNPTAPTNLCCVDPACCLANACNVFSAMAYALNNYRNMGNTYESFNSSFTVSTGRLLSIFLHFSGSPYNIEAGVGCPNAFALGYSDPSFSGNIATDCTTTGSFGCYDMSPNFTNDNLDAYLAWTTQCVTFTSIDPNCTNLYFCFEIMYDDNPYFPGEFQANFRNAHICMADPGLIIGNCQDCTQNNPVVPPACDISETITTSLVDTVDGGNWSTLATFNVFVPDCCGDSGLPFVITSSDPDLVFLTAAPTITPNTLHTFDMDFQYNGTTPGVYNITINVATPSCGNIDYDLVLTVNACSSRISDMVNPPFIGVIPLNPISFSGSGTPYSVGSFYIFVPSCCGSIGNNFSIYTQDANITMVTVGGASVSGVNVINIQISSITPGVYNAYVLTISLPGCGKIDYVLDITVT